MAKTIYKSGSFIKKKSKNESGLPDDVIAAMQELALDKDMDWLEFKSEDNKMYLVLKSYEDGDDSPFNLIVSNVVYTSDEFEEYSAHSVADTVKNVPADDSWRDIV